MLRIRLFIDCPRIFPRHLFKHDTYSCSLKMTIFPYTLMTQTCISFKSSVCKTHVLCYQRSSRTRGCRKCLFSAPEENFTSTEFPPCWMSTSSEASLFTTCPSQMETLPSWNSAARFLRSCRSALRTTGGR